MKSTKIKKFLIGLFILGIINVPYFSLAETQIEIQEGEIGVTISPNSPGPYQDVSINLSSYATDLNKAIITWQYGAKTVLSGIGKTSYSFKTEGVGSSNIIIINITPVGSMSTITKKINIAPAEIEIMWESVDGYTPPFYRGKSLPISGGLIKAVAIPNTNTIKSGNGSISYIWKNNDSVVEASSGYNKNAYVFKNSMFDEINQIGVQASSVAGNYNAESMIEIPIYKSKLLFYKKSPTENVLYNNALNKETTMLENEMTIVAEPYFLPIKGGEESLAYTWKINGQNVATPSKKTEMTIRPSSRGGYATINLSMENINKLFQEVSNQLKINL